MEYRDLPRVVASDDDGDDPVPRPRRFPLARHGRLDVRKVATVVMLGVSLLAVLFYAGRQATDAVTTWLHAQPRYQLAFGRIELPTPPPECFRGGSAAFLERVRRNAKEPETLALLDLDPARLRNAFKSFPWVEEVGEIDRPPGGLTIHLKYRRPVAKVQFGPASQFVLDREGCILPLEDLDVGRLGRLIRIVGKGLTAPAKDREGRIWKTATPEEPGREVADRGVVQAAKLAAFFLDPAREAEATPGGPMQIIAVIATDPKANRGLFVENARGVQILWGRAPGDEEPGELTSAEKWELLAKQVRQGLTQDKREDYWTFNRSGMVYIPYQPSAPRS